VAAAGLVALGAAAERAVRTQVHDFPCRESPSDFDLIGALKVRKIIDAFLHKNGYARVVVEEGEEAEKSGKPKNIRASKELQTF
jgi:hypothetical protein